MTTKTTSSGGRPPVGKARGDGTVSDQTRWIPGVGQAHALNERAAAMNAEGTRPGKVTRAALLREIITWGLARPAAEMRAQDPVPPAPNSAPLAEKQVTFVPGADQLKKLDAQATRVKVPGDARGRRNALLRMHVAAWLGADGNAG